jgi:murein DD-endopeptidase MepM/ murein hydrolase activator NlpD
MADERTSANESLPEESPAEAAVENNAAASLEASLEAALQQYADRHESELAPSQPEDSLSQPGEEDEEKGREAQAVQTAGEEQPLTTTAASSARPYWQAGSVLLALALLAWLVKQVLSPAAVVPTSRQTKPTEAAAIQQPTTQTAGAQAAGVEKVQSRLTPAGSTLATAATRPTEEGTAIAAISPPATLPVITLNNLPDLALGNDSLPAVAAEGGQPLVIRSLAAELGTGLDQIPLEERLSKRPRVLPAIDFLPSAADAAAQLQEPPTPTPIPVVLAPGRAWVNFAPLPPTENDHYWVDRPFPPSVANQMAAPNYQFGSTAGGRYRVHHGMDIPNALGTPVLAGATGEVIHAGPDNPTLLGPYVNFYGNAVVIRLDRRLTVSGGGLDVFLLYGHLSQTWVSVGQRVQPSDVIGLVGMTGIAIGPHLHVEMRVGANTYEQSVNPYLWVRPLTGTGAVAVRLLTADGRTWPNARLTLARFVDGAAVWARVIETYPDDESVNPNPAWGENGAMDGVPAGSYYLYGLINGERVATNLQINADETSFVEMRTQQ